MSFRDVDNRVGYLKRHLRIVVGGQDEIINIMAELPDGHDAAQLVNSVVDAYISKYVEQRRIENGRCSQCPTQRQGTSGLPNWKSAARHWKIFDSSTRRLPST